MKIRHHSIFNNLDSDKINWNKIRNDPSEKKYFIPLKKYDYVKEAKSKNYYKELISEILIILKQFKIKSIFSLGSGRAYLEYGIKQKNILVTISDYDDSIDRIKKFKIFDNVYKLNFKDVFSKLHNYKGMVLLSRIDTEVSDEELIEIFNGLARNKIKYIFFIPAQVLTLKSFSFQIYIRIKSILLRKKLIFCGYSRSEKLLKKFWKSHYKSSKMADSKSFFLQLL